MSALEQYVVILFLLPVAELLHFQKFPILIKIQKKKKLSLYNETLEVK